MILGAGGITERSNCKYLITVTFLSYLLLVQNTTLHVVYSTSLVHAQTALLQHSHQPCKVDYYVGSARFRGGGLPKTIYSWIRGTFTCKKVQPSSLNLKLSLAVLHRNKGNASLRMTPSNPSRVALSSRGYSLPLKNL